MDQEKELIIALKQGNEKAFNILYKQYWKQVYNFCRLYLTNMEEAEEVVQDVFVRLWQSRDFLRENDNFKGLLFIISRNLVFNQTRKSFNHDFYTLSLLEALENMPEENSYDIEKELEAKSHRSGGRRSGDIKSISNIDVQVEELEDDNKEEDYLNTQTKTNTVANQIKNLPPEIKALLLSNIFDKKD